MTDEDQSGEGKKKPSPVMTIAIVAGLSVLAVGGGWLVGNLLAPSAPAEAVAAEAAGEQGGKKGEDGDLPRLATEANGIVTLEPFTSNLAYPADNLVRMEVALAFKDAPDPALAEAIHQDIMAYMRTVSLQQIQGPRGFQYLRDDLMERVDLRSEGRVTNLMFRTFVIE
ncbi:flagellar basal body-associated FliL family protein [Rhizobium sp. ARZ01]|uniref:flagellar basal body-associated FliL family protein n=1 Tax=Rhizobium sp. ARZ01 TaxID=2769313 RepID=UPI001785206D|nr:flagellar basal body-associated FliL family protein [Rhizobium sp. ARZ01]MBD9373859.1 flagellar basal body-associated FliL family protein [Rhizobium sp. ARZ01]